MSNVIVNFVILVLILLSGRLEAMYSEGSTSPFRQFISFYFSYIPIPSTPVLDSSSNNYGEEARNDYYYNNKGQSVNLESSINDSCIFHSNFFEQCDINETKLLCYPRPRRSTFILHRFEYSKCDCFSWEKIKMDEYLLREIFQEDDEDMRILLMDLANFLNIEMEFDGSQCRSLNGSACSVQEPEYQMTSEVQDNSTILEEDVDQSDDLSYIPYVQCAQGLKCQEISEPDFVIGRCLPLDKGLSS